MGAIAGIIYPDMFQLNNLLDPMLKIMAHRGPRTRDDYVYKNMRLGVCGQTVSINTKKTVAVLLDGNIYNSNEIKQNLLKQGCHCLSTSSSEIALSAYECFGKDFLQMIDGDFAVAVFDRQEEVLLLARDRIGNKPLYWYHEHHYFIFASELKAILATGIISQTPAMDALSSYLTLGYIPQDMTAVQKISRLLPGHALRFSLKETKSIYAYWSYSSYFTQKNLYPRDSSPDELNSLLEQSVEKRLEGERSVGCLVSGGLGSAGIAYYVHSKHPFSLKAFSANFQGQTDEDLHAASLVTRTLKIPHLIHHITPNSFLDDFVKISWFLDEPLTDPNVFATWNLAKLASQETHTVFSGMGSDELLAGHGRYTSEERRNVLKKWLTHLTQPLVQHLLVPLLTSIDSQKAYSLLKGSKTNPWQRGYLKQNVLFDEKILSQAAPALAELFDSDTFLLKFHNLPQIKSLISSFLYLDVKTRLTDCYSLQYDRLMCANQLDWRPPFFDKDVIAYLAGFSNPDHLGQQDTAWLLKEILKKVFPSELINRPKKTRRNFLSSWSTLSGIEKVFQVLPRGALVEAGLISEKWIRAQLETKRKERCSFQYLWAILALEVWFRLFINSAVKLEPPEVSLRHFLEET